MKKFLSNPIAYIAIAMGIVYQICWFYGAWWGGLMGIGILSIGKEMLKGWSYGSNGVIWAELMAADKAESINILINKWVWTKRFY